MDSKNIINWSELSRFLTKGDRTGVQKNRIPKKYLSRIRRLIKLINDWQHETNGK